MVRLDRSTGIPKLVLTGVFAPMVRSSRTMTREGALRLAALFLARVGPVPGMTNVERRPDAKLLGVAFPCVGRITATSATQISETSRSHRVTNV